MSSQTEAEAVAELTRQTAIPRSLDPLQIYVVSGPNGPVVLDGESRWAQPRRKSFQFQVFDAESLVRFWQTQGDDKETTTLYADYEHHHLVAIFNDAKAKAGWRDHRALLKTRQTLEWQHWAKLSGKLVSQGEFADHIEQGLDEISDPPGADILELAQTFEANQRVAFKSGIILANGARALEYVQTVEARAGVQGQIIIPKEFVLGLAPFEGSAPHSVIARLRYRIADEKLSIGYALLRPEKVQDEAFDAIIKKVERETKLEALRGSPELPK